MPWYRRESILEYLETVYVAGDRNLVDFRLPVQYVLRPSAGGSAPYADRSPRALVKRGDEVMVLPSRTAGRVKSLVELVAGSPLRGVRVRPHVGHADAGPGRSTSREATCSSIPGTSPWSSRASRRCLCGWMPGGYGPEPHVSREAHHPGQQGDGRGVDYRVDVNTLSRVPAASRCSSTRSAALPSGPASRSS